MNKWFKISGGVAAVAVAGVLTIGGIAFAQETPGTDAGQDNGRPTFFQRGERGDRGDRGGANIIDRDPIKAVTAQALNMTVAELEAAKEAGQRLPEIAEAQGVEMAVVEAAVKAEATSQVNQALADGTITQEQADRMLERIEEGRGFGKGRHGRGGKHGDHAGAGIIDREAMKAVTAQALNMSVAELDAAKEAGQRLPEIAEAQGVEMAVVEAAVKAEATSQVNQALADGTITQEQADRMLERIEEGHGIGKGRHGRGGKHGDHAGAGIIDREAMKAVTAQALNMSVAELDAAKEAGQHLPEIAEAQGVEMTVVEAAMKAEATRQVNQAVVDGTITQEQADQILERIEEGRGFGKGRRGGEGRRGPGSDRQNQDNAPDGVQEDNESAGNNVENITA